MTNSKDKYIKVNINEEILNLCPDLEPEQQITLANIIDNDNEFRSCPLKVNNTVHFEQTDYVSEWTDLEGVDLNKLLYIHRFELLLNEKFKDKVVNSDFNLTEDVYNEVKKFYNSCNPEAVI